MLALPEPSDQVGPVLCLLPSPLLGPAMWTPVSDRLRAEGWPTLVVGNPPRPPSSPADVLSHLLSTLPSDRELVLIPHSNAGLYVPALTAERDVAAAVFVDAGVPPPATAVPVTPSGLYDELVALADDEGMLPPWTEWWEEDAVAGLFPDAAAREAVQREQQRLPLAYFAESVPVPPGWLTVPCAYLGFGDTYAAERERAAALKWPVRTLPGGHLHMLVDPQAVAAAITAELAAVGVVRARQE